MHRTSTAFCAILLLLAPARPALAQGGLRWEVKTGADFVVSSPGLPGDPDFWSRGFALAFGMMGAVAPHAELGIATSWARFSASGSAPPSGPTPPGFHQKTQTGPAHLTEVALHVRAFPLRDFTGVCAILGAGLQFSHFGDVRLLQWTEPAPRPVQGSFFRDAADRSVAPFWAAGAGYVVNLSGPIGGLVEAIGIRSFDGDVSHMALTLSVRYRL